MFVPIDPVEPSTTTRRRVPLDNFEMALDSVTKVFAGAGIPLRHSTVEGSKVATATARKQKPGDFRHPAGMDSWIDQSNKKFLPRR